MQKSHFGLMVEFLEHVHVESACPYLPQWPGQGSVGAEGASKDSH